MAKVYYVPVLTKKETKKTIIGEILLKEFKDKVKAGIKDEYIFIYFDILSNADASFMGDLDLNKAVEKLEKIKDKLFNSKEPMLIALPLEYNETVKIIEQKRMLNPNAIIVVFRTEKNNPVYKNFHKVALENSDEVYSRVKLFTYEHKTLSFFIVVAVFLMVMLIISLLLSIN